MQRFLAMTLFLLGLSMNAPGMAWIDYQRTDHDRRRELSRAGFRLRLVHRFSF